MRTAVNADAAAHGACSCGTLFHVLRQSVDVKGRLQFGLVEDFHALPDLQADAVGPERLLLRHVQGLVALMLRVYSNRTADEILSTSSDFLTQIGLDKHLSPTRKNGLAAMTSNIKLSASQLHK